jgi:hypothetical protein
VSDDVLANPSAIDLEFPALDPDHRALVGDHRLAADACGDPSISGSNVVIRFVTRLHLALLWR